MASDDFRDAVEFSAPSVKFTPESDKGPYGLLRIENPNDIVRLEDISHFAHRGRTSVTRTVLMDRTGAAYRAQSSAKDILDTFVAGKPLEVRAALMQDYELSQLAATQFTLGTRSNKLAPVLDSDHFTFERDKQTTAHKAPGELTVKNTGGILAIGNITKEAYSPSSGDRSFTAAAILFEDGGSFTVPVTFGEIVNAAKTQAAAQEKLTFPAYVNYEMLRQTALALSLSHFRGENPNEDAPAAAL